MWRDRVGRAQLSTLSAEFDWQQLQQLAGGDAAFEAELLAMFLEDAKNSLQQLEAAIATQNARTIEDVAHSLRGASANVGASTIAEIALELENTARAGETHNARQLVQEIGIHYQKIQSQLRT
ncbi:Hpt domain-containing protein [cf. Phormidesmis sp. LEGE 11477]|uniref:Hpt domain-containing protein n=1 Tax=cf. Phormidesmis sp. LEGE 11477 TaxID=1828680 RepID=UPI00187E688F|nr:Hpt domain-containing protein [cf. Phormidesmis sp. LEGE 11477]MBE9064719.1 Hpt domain-containing protein [cf. Phormidesmis sp. LEGE 11477]